MVRKNIIENILCTDMGKHAGIQNEIKEIGSLPEAERELSGKNKNILLRAVVHAADISNPTKPFDIAT